jgi:glycosyltransferase involved in cell wall biosynthesis
MTFSNKHILILIENLSVPFDRRVWQEATTLKEFGAEVSIICPMMKDYTKRNEIIDGIIIYRYPLQVEARSAFGYLLEYFIALFWTFVYSWKIFIKKRFHVIHACNPPDLFFLVALCFKPFGVQYVFDHHDINPELYIAKYGRKDLFYRLMLLFERITFMAANYSIATNESYKDIAVHRGKMPVDKVTVIRSGPQMDRLKIIPPNDKYKKGRKYLIGYVGTIGEQEGIDLLLDSIQYIVSKRTDVQCAIVGGGTDLEKMKVYCRSLQLEEYVDFYGRSPDALMLAIINTADVCVNPDKPTEMNNLSTMNKIMEYMALKKPIVQYDLKEGRYSAQEASLYARCGDIKDFGEKILWLLDHEQKRIEMGENGYNRVVNELSWKYESKKLICFYGRVLDLQLAGIKSE